MKFPALLNRLLNKGGVRALDAAGGGRRWADDRRVISASTLHNEAATIGARAAHFALNNPTGARIVESLVGNLIGDGIVPRSEHADRAVRETLHGAFKPWTDRADADGRRDFYGLQQDAARDMIVFGEFLFIIVQDPANGAPQLRRLSPEQLDRAMTRNAGGGNAIVQGVEFDRNGQIIAYHVRQSPAGDPLAGLAIRPMRIPASDILHGFRPVYPGQVRGLSWLAPVLLSAHSYDALQDAIMERAKVAALHAGFVRDASGGTPYSGEQTGDTLIASLEPGALITLPAGKDIEFPSVPEQTGALELMRDVMRRIAAGVGLTYEQVSGDYSQVNYSSARAALLEFRRFASGVQHHQLVFQFCRPAWRRFVAWQAFAGTINAPAYQSAPQAFEAAKWLPPAWPWVDPKKDAEAAAIEVKNQFKSRSEVIAERGYDAEDVDREITADAARLETAPKTGGVKDAA